VRGGKNPLHAKHGEGDRPRTRSGAGGGAISDARRLRKDMSLPEVLLWQRLRGRDGGRKFRRQHPVGGYVLDFYCARARLVIEIDGEAHNRGNRPQRDAVRDMRLTERGLRIVRIAAADVLRDADTVADAIVAMAQPLHHLPAASGPPPHAAHGEDLSITHGANRPRAGEE